MAKMDPTARVAIGQANNTNSNVVQQHKYTMPRPGAARMLMLFPAAALLLTLLVVGPQPAAAAYDFKTAYRAITFSAIAYVRACVHTKALCLR